MKVGCTGSDTEKGGGMHNKQHRVTEVQRKKEKREERESAIELRDNIYIIKIL